MIEKTLLKCRILSHVWQQKYKSGNAPVKDNCYITIYRGFTHEECSLNYKIETPKVFVEQNDNCNSKNTVSFPILKKKKKKMKERKPYRVIGISRIQADGFKQESIMAGFNLHYIL